MTSPSAPDRPDAGEPRLVLGLMSGMSMDGLDVALVRLTGHGERPAVELLGATTLGYPDTLRARLQAARGPASAESAALDAELPELWGQGVCDWLAADGIETSAIACLGSHGQTLFHRPRVDGAVAETLQVGRGDVLAARTGIRTVCDFRQADIVAGGEGAPLVPMADWILHAGETTTACNNLGSISNVTVLPPAREAIMAFDTGPANMLIDAFARRIDGRIDLDGALSAQGTIDEDVLLTLYVQRAGWLAQPPPKSAGYGTFGPQLVDLVLAKHPDAREHDLVRTAVEFTARTLSEAYARFVCTRFPDLQRVRFSGGGTRNPTLMQAIRVHLAGLGLTVEVIEGELNDAKEAVAFALLADRTVRGLPGNVPSATGAERAVVLGRLHEPEPAA